MRRLLDRLLALVVVASTGCGGSGSDGTAAAGSPGGAGASPGIGGGAGTSAGASGEAGTSAGGAGGAGFAGAGGAGAGGAGFAGASGAGAGGGGQGGAGASGAKGGGSGVGGTGGQGGAVATRIRVLAGNLSSGTKQNWDPGDGIRLLSGLSPDIALLQELNYGSGSTADLADFATKAMGPGTSIFREPGKAIPNGVLSRFPIIDQGTFVDPEVDNRSFTWVLIDVPGDEDLFAVSVHLLTTSATKRELEATSLVAALQSGLPRGAWLVVGGDLNTGTRVEPCVDVLSAMLDVKPPWPLDNLGNENTSAPRTKPFDWLLTNAPLRAHEVPVVLGSTSFVSGLVFDSRVFTPLDAVPPITMADSAATGMQHMPVVRDFLLPP